MKPGTHSSGASRIWSRCPTSASGRRELSIFLTVYMDERGDVQAHKGSDPLDFPTEVPAHWGLLYRAVVEGSIVEDECNEG